MAWAVEHDGTTTASLHRNTPGMNNCEWKGAQGSDNGKHCPIGPCDFSTKIFGVAYLSTVFFFTFSISGLLPLLVNMILEFAIRTTTGLQSAETGTLATFVFSLFYY